MASEEKQEQTVEGGAVPPSAGKTTTQRKAATSKKVQRSLDERVPLLGGLLVILLSLLLFIAMVSHLFAWAKDQSLSWQNIFSPSELVVGNVIGPLGASLASSLVTHGFGLASFVIPLLCFMYGLRIWNIRFSRWKKRQMLLMVGMLLSSILLGYLFRATGGLLGFGFGGKFGYYVSTWLIDFMSPVGAGFLLLFLSVAYLVWLRPRLTHSLLSLLQGAGRSLVMHVHSARVARPVEPTTYDAPTPSEAAVASLASEEEVKDAEATKTKADKEALSADGPSTPQEVAQEGEEVLVPLEVVSSQPERREQQELCLRPVVEEEGEEAETLLGENFPVEESTFEIYTPSAEDDDQDAGEGAHTEPYDPTLDLANYALPPLSLLDEHDEDAQLVSAEELNDNNRRIKKTLSEFNIEIEKIVATIGPTVTLYEILPAPGIRVSKIESLEKDLAMRLEAIGVRIFIRKGAIGIEVPNQKPATVSMRSVLESKKFQEHKGALPLALGRTISNEAFVVDLEKMPHLLVAGATGQGKSVGLNAIIASILFKKHPSQVKLVMVDPKKVEFSLYAKIENYFLAKLPEEEEAIITDSDKVIYTLNSLCVEMDHRLNMLKEAQVRNITEYNEKFVARRLNPEKGHAYMPRIVVIVDEFADLMMTSSSDVVPPLMRLAQLGRAPGIHLVIATQRPTTDILVGKIKANIPARIAFRVTSGTDSRTILDMPGADRLIGRGDMLVKTDSLNVDRVQCAFLSTEEVARITDYIAQQQSYFSAWMLPDVDTGGGKSDDDGGGSGELDPLFEEVKRYVIAEGTCSTSNIQRVFTVGYPRAGRIVSQLERAGVVSAKRGTKEREVLV